MRHFGPNAFRHDEDGGATTIEFVLWLPIFLLIIGLIVDVCWLMYAQSRAYDIAADTARRWSLGVLPDEAAAESYAAATGELQGVQPATSASFESTGMLTVTLSYPLTKVDLVGFFAVAPGASISTTVTHWKYE